MGGLPRAPLRPPPRVDPQGLAHAGVHLQQLPIANMPEANRLQVLQKREGVGTLQSNNGALCGYLPQAPEAHRQVPEVRIVAGYSI